MKKKSTLIIALLLIVCLFAVVFVGCDPKTNPEVDPDEIDPPPPPPPVEVEDKPIRYTAAQIMGYVVDSLSNDGEMANFQIEMDCLTNNGENETKILIQANLIDESNIEFSLKAVEGDNIVFGIYLVNDKLFVDLGDEVLYLEDFNMAYIVDILANALGLIDLDSIKILDMGIKELLPTVYGLLFTSPTGTIGEETAEFGLKIEINALLNSVLPLVEGFLPASDIYTLTPIFNWLKNDLPKVCFDIKAVMNKDLNNPELISLGITMTDQEVGESFNDVIFDMNAGVTIASEKISIDIPDSVENFVPFSFTNIRTQVDLLLNTTNAVEDSKKIDVGSLINIFADLAGTDEILPEGLLFLEAELGFRLKLNIDLDLNYAGLNVDNNLILIEIYSLSMKGEESVNPLLGIYYRDGALYVSLENLLPNYWGSRNIKVNVSIADLLRGVVNKLTSLIDNALDTDWSAANAKELAEAALSGVTVVEDQEAVKPIISDTLSSFVTAVASVLYMEDYIKAQGNSLSITANSDFIKKIMAIAAVDSEVVDSFPDFGSAVLSLNFGSDFNIALDVNVGDPKGENLYLGLKVHSFGIGRVDDTLKENIAGKTTDSKYTSNLTDLIYDLLGGTELNMGIGISFNKGIYNLAGLLTMFGLDAFKDTEILWEFTQDSLINMDLKIGFELDFINHSNSEFVLEIKSREAIMVGGQEAYPSNTVIAGIYGINNKVYVDLSNLRIAQISLPKIAVDIDFTSIIASLLSRYVSDKTLEFDIASLLGLSNGDESVPLPEEMVDAIFADETGENLSPVGEIVLGLNAEALTVNFSLSAIFELLKAFNVGGDIDLGDMSLMGSISASNTKGIVIDVNGDLLKPLINTQYENGGLSNLNIKLETGTNNYPIKFGGADLGIKIDDGSYATDDLIGAIVEVASGISLEGKIKLTTEDTKIDFAQVVNNILAASGQEFTMPITLSLDDWQSDVTLNLAWKLNFTNMTETKLLLEFKYQEKLLLGAYMQNNQIAVDLSGLGLFPIKLVNSTIISYLVNMINDMISDLGEMNLTELINGLLKDNGIISDADIANGNAGSSADPAFNENASEPLFSYYANDIGQTEIGGARVDQDLAIKLAEAMASGDTMSIVAVILNCVSVQNTDIFVSFQEDMVDALLRSLLGVGLGLDVSLFGKIEMTEGKANLTVNIDKITCEIDLALKVGKDSASINIDELLSKVNFAGIPNWDASNGRALTKALLDNLNICLNVDIAMKNSDTAKSVLYTRLTIEKLTEKRTLTNTSSTSTVDRGAILITLSDINEARYNNSNAGSSTAILYAAINPSYTGINIWLCKGVLSLGALYDFSGAVNGMGIELNLLDKLAPVFQNLLDSLIVARADEPVLLNVEPVSVAPKTLAAEGELTGFDAILANFDVLKLFDSSGIRIALRSTGTFNVEVSLNTYVVNKLIDDVFHCLFGKNTIIDLRTLHSGFSKNYMELFDWNRLAADVFYDSISAQLRDILRDVLNNILYPDTIGVKLGGLITNAILGGIKDQLQRLTRRLLPLPVYNDMSVGLNIVDGTFANLYLMGYDKNENVVDENGDIYYMVDNSGKKWEYRTDAGVGNGHRSNFLYSEVKLYNASPSVGDKNYSTDNETIGIVNWGDIKQTITIDPYEYSSNIDNKAADILGDFFTNKLAEYQQARNIYKKTIAFSIDLENGATENYVSLTTETLKQALSKAGKYKVKATAEFADTVTKTFEMSLVVLEQTEIIGVEPIAMHAYETAPDYITVTFEQGTNEEKYNTREIALSTVTGIDDGLLPDYSEGNFGEQEVTKTIYFANGIESTLSCLFYDSTIVELYASGSEVEIDLLSYIGIDELKAKYCPETIYFKYPDGSYGKVRVKAEDWDLSELNAFTERSNEDLSGGVFTAKATVMSGTSIEQTVEIKFIVKSENILAVEVKGSVDKVIVDPYDYYMFTQNVEGYTSPYPNVITIHYGDIEGGEIINAYSKDVNVVWSGIPQAYDYTKTTKGMLTIKPDATYYLGENVGELKYTWTKEIPYTINTNIIKTVYFDEKHTQTVLEIDPLMYHAKVKMGESYYPSKVFVEYITGDIAELPVAWTIPEGFTVGFTDTVSQFTATFGFDLAKYANNSDTIVPVNAGGGKTYTQSLKVNVRVNGSSIRGILLDGSDLSRDEKLAEFNLTGVYEIDGIESVYSAEGVTDAIFPKTVKILYEDMTVREVNVKTWTFNKDDITDGRKTGIIAKLTLENDAVYEIVCQTKNRSNPVLVNSEIEINPYVYKVDAKGGIYYTEYTPTMDFIYNVYDLDGKQVYEVNEKGEMTETPKTEVISLPVTWATSNVSYSWKGGIYKAFVYLGKGTAFEKRLTVNVTVLNKELDRVTYYGEDYITIPKGATNLPMGAATTEATYRMNVYFKGDSQTAFAIDVVVLFTDVSFNTANATITSTNGVNTFAWIENANVVKATVIIGDGRTGIYQELNNAISIAIVDEIEITVN